MSFDCAREICARSEPLGRHHHCGKGLLTYHLIVPGRYGDALNPWGDIITVARVSCLATPDSKVIAPFLDKS